MTGTNRPWPPPIAPWVMMQTWSDLLFAHWPVPVEALEQLVPTVIPLDTWEGQAWVGIVPFYLSNLRAHGLPAPPWVSRFTELNLRTYTTIDGKPGVYFFSLDARNPLAVAAARISYFLPYYRAAMRIRRTGEWVYYSSRRVHAGSPPATLRMRYRPTGPVFTAYPGTLEYFLTERYCLYSIRADGALFRAEIDHKPWPLQVADADIYESSLAESQGIQLPSQLPLLHYARRQDMVAWLPARVR